MEEMSSFWSYQETIDELKQQLIYATLEIETVRAQANAEKSKNREYTMQLFQLVKTVCKERDEAKAQLQKLLNKTMPSDSITPYPQLQPDSPLINTTKANSSLTKCNSFSDTYNYHSHSSSPANNSFSDPISSPDLSNLNQLSDQEYHDEGSLVIEKLVEGKPLPEKGKLLRAVMGAGPLLQTLMVAGHLPRWRNPPPQQPLELPPFCINKGLDTSFVPKVLDSSFVEINYGSSHMISTSSMVNLSGAYTSCLSSAESLIAAGTNVSNFGFSRKRQRLQNF